MLDYHNFLIKNATQKTTSFTASTGTFDSPVEGEHAAILRLESVIESLLEPRQFQLVEL